MSWLIKNVTDRKEATTWKVRSYMVEEIMTSTGEALNRAARMQVEFSEIPHRFKDSVIQLEEETNNTVKSSSENY